MVGIEEVWKIQEQPKVPGEKNFGEGAKLDLPVSHFLPFPKNLITPIKGEITQISPLNLSMK